MKEKTLSQKSAAPTTLILNQSAIARTMTWGDYLTAAELAFAGHANGKIQVPGVVHIPFSKGAFHIKSAAYVDDPFYVAVKVNGNFPDNPRLLGLPTIQGAILLCDGDRGTPLAILDSMEVTARRTAAATALAARHLANPDGRTVAMIGCGIQGKINLEALHHVLPLNRVFAFDLDAGAAKSFAREMTARTGVEVTAVAEIGQATLRSTIIVTCTSSRNGFLNPDHVKPGTFIAAVGADNHDKQELEPALIGKAGVVVDILEQCAQIGELHHAIEAGVMTRSSVRAELGQVVTGREPGRQASEEIVVFDSTGSAIQDLTAAAQIYRRARAMNLGLPVTFA